MTDWKTEFEVTKKRYYELLRVRKVTDYEYRNSVTPEASILIEVNTGNTTLNTHTQETEAAPEPEADKVCVPPTQEKSFGELHREQRARIKEAFKRVQGEYKGQKYESDLPIFLREVRTDDDVGLFFATLELYKQTRKFREKYIPSLRTYLTRGDWKTPPNGEEPLAADPADDYFARRLAELEAEEAKK